MEEFDLHEKVALISGASQGMGYAMALTLARHGADIFGVSIGDDSDLKKEVEAMGRRYHSITISLTTPGAIHTVIKEVLGAYGHVDILLNFAGITKKMDTLDMTKMDWNAVFDINVSAAFLLAKEVIQQFRMQGHGGKIINASGILPLHTSEYCAYSASKGAVEAMTRYLAMEFGKDDIQVNAITFGFMTTGTSLMSGDGNQYDDSILRDIPAKRWGCYKDVDGLLLLLASAQSNYITGACIPVDGGYSI